MMRVKRPTSLLTAAEIVHWLDGLPSTRVVGYGGYAKRDLLATYLTQNDIRSSFGQWFTNGSQYPRSGSLTRWLAKLAIFYPMQSFTAREAREALAVVWRERPWMVEVPCHRRVA